MERLMKVVCVFVVMACVAPVMAQTIITWDGGAGTNEFTAVDNWTLDPSDPGLGVNVLDLRVSTAITGDAYWNAAPKIKDADLVQTSGNVEFYTGQDNYPVFSMFRNTHAFDMSGGTFTTWGQFGLGNSGGGGDGTAWMNLSGDAVATLLRPKNTAITRTGLLISGTSGFSITGDATLIMDGSFIPDVATLQVYADLGYFVAGAGETLQIDVIQKDIVQIDNDGVEYASTIDCYQITAVPEPATLVLLGLGSLITFRRKR